MLLHFSVILFVAVLTEGQWTIHQDRYPEGLDFYVETNNQSIKFPSNYKNQLDYVNTNCYEGFIKTPEVKRAVLKVERKNYEQNNPYNNFPVPIGFGATFTPLQMQGFVLDLLKGHLKEGSKVLDVGSGTGYMTAVLALMVGSAGRVVGLDHIPELVKISIDNIRKDHPVLLEQGRVKLVEGDGRLGFPEEGPYDVIYVGVFCYRIPETLVNQLTVGGRMVIPVVLDNAAFLMHNLMVVDNYINYTSFLVERDGKFVPKYSEPLVDKDAQLHATLPKEYENFYGRTDYT